jgi:hypothetical protein
MIAKIIEPMKRKRTVQVFDVEEWPICEYCGMPIEPNEVDWHKHHERWLIRQRLEAETINSRSDDPNKAAESSDDFVPRVYLTAEMLEPPKP